jgi:hypothetical protein
MVFLSIPLGLFVANKMEIELDISKKIFILLLIGIFLLIGSFFVYAYGTNFPQIIGHSGGEIEIIYGGVQMSLNDALTTTLDSKNLECNIKIKSIQLPPYPGQGFSVDCDSGDLNTNTDDYYSVGGWCFDTATSSSCDFNIPLGDSGSWFGWDYSTPSPLGTAYIYTKCCRSKIV